MFYVETGEADIHGQPCLHIEFEDSQSYIEGTCLKTNKPPKTTKKHKMPTLFLDTGGQAFENRRKSQVKLFFEKPRCVLHSPGTTEHPLRAPWGDKSSPSNSEAVIVPLGSTKPFVPGKLKLLTRSFLQWSLFTGYS